MKIEIYTVSALQRFILSDRFLNSDILPVSPERIASYMNNPRAEGSMPVLFLYTENERIIAYRTVLPDNLSAEGEITGFAWLSGNYVVPGHRRTGISGRLFKVVEDAWNGMLMYTNYAPASKAVYDKTGSFAQFTERPGKRYYMRSSLELLLSNRFSHRGLLRLGDSILNGIHELTSAGMQFPPIPDTDISQVDMIDEELAGLIMSIQEKSLFHRGISEFEWIRNDPWVTENPDSLPDAEYHFSRRVSKFRSRWFKLKSSAGVAFLWITHVDKKCSVPYFIHNDPLLITTARQVVLNEMVSEGASYITTRHPELGPVLGTRRNPFILSRDMSQRYFAHKNLIRIIPAGPDIHDGDGDVVFT